MGSSGTVKNHSNTSLVVPKNGYVFVFCSNESPHNVFFDNVQVIHARGPVLEETHYYPFGLTMAGISCKAAGMQANKDQTFQGQKFDDDLGLSWHQFKWRNHDPQVGRFNEIDPLSQQYAHNSTYAFSENKVIDHVELEGLEGIKYTEVNKNGQTTTIVVKNIVILTKMTSPENSERRNARIEARNKEKIAETKNDLNTFYNDTDGKGALDANGNNVRFIFNIISLPSENTDGGSRRDITALGIKYGIPSPDKEFDGGPNKISPAAIFTTKGAGGSHGVMDGLAFSVNFGSPPGTISHEVGHQLKLNDDYPNGSGGVMDSPPGRVSPSEVSKIVEKSPNALNICISCFLSSFLK